jgi:hypothetical protein
MTANADLAPFQCNFLPEDSTKVVSPPLKLVIVHPDLRCENRANLKKAEAR